MLKQTDIFEAGKGGYHTYRIPALAVSRKGTILAFCEGRKYSEDDAGKIDLLLKRSPDSGENWQETQLLVADGDNTCGNPCPVVDQSDGTIWLLFCKNLSEGHEGLIIGGQAPRTAWVTKSTDDGVTWSEPHEITKDVKAASWTWYATGPGHGIQLGNGRLMIPCDHGLGVDVDADLDLGLEGILHSHIIYSDDHGKTWQVGGIVDKGTNECAIVQAVDGAVYINCRNYIGAKRRAVAWSQDNGVTFSKRGWDETLIEPICQASIVRFTDKDSHDKNRILFSNPASTGRRENLTVRVSYDECWTWAESKLLCKGPSAYSDLAITHDMTICCLYEWGEEHPYEKLTFAQFTIEWLTDGADYLRRGSGRALTKREKSA